jgi:hypothetical protein
MSFCPLPEVSARKKAPVNERRSSLLAASRRAAYRGRTLQQETGYFWNSSGETWLT